MAFEKLMWLGEAGLGVRGFAARLRERVRTFEIADRFFVGRRSVCAYFKRFFDFEIADRFFVGRRSACAYFKRLFDFAICLR